MEIATSILISVAIIGAVCFSVYAPSCGYFFNRYYKTLGENAELSNKYLELEKRWHSGLKSIQYTGHNNDEIEKWSNKKARFIGSHPVHSVSSDGEVQYEGHSTAGMYLISDRGDIRLVASDYIIKDGSGIFYMIPTHIYQSYIHEK